MFNHILAPLDGSALAECVLPHLVGMAKTFDARVTLLCVLKPDAEGGTPYPIDPVAWEIKKSETGAYLNEIVHRLDETGTPVEQILLEGDPASCIKEFTDKYNVDLILLSSHGRSGLSRWNVSSVVHKVIQRAHRSFMLVRAYKSEQPELKGIQYHKLLLPLDGSQRAECLFSPAKTVAQFYNAQLLVAHVTVKPEMPHQMPLTAEDQTLMARFIERNKQLATDYLEGLRSRLPYDFESRLRVSEDVALTLHEMVDEEAVDLLIMSAHGYSGQTKWPYGSITTSFIEYGSVPMLVVQDLKPEEIEPTKAETAVVESKGH
jgi:nucleotide-binding universal stress UspA family protein